MDFIFSVLSIEDSLDDAASLRDTLAGMPSFRYAGNAPTYERGRELILRHHPDLLFLDIDLPDANGLEVVNDIRLLATWPMKIVFYTVHDNYVIEALRNAAYDYLIKPLRHEELHALLDRFTNDHNERYMRYGSRQMADGLPDDSIIMVNTIQGYQQIRLTDVVYLKHVPRTKYWRLYMADETVQTLKKETSAPTILSMHRQFAQVNQSQIINLRYLGILRRDSCTLLPPFDGVRVDVSRNYLPALQSRMLFI